METIWENKPDDLVARIEKALSNAINDQYGKPNGIEITARFVPREEGEEKKKDEVVGA